MRPAFKGWGVRAAIALGAAFPALAVPAAAHAKPFATDAFELELGPARVCFVVPVSLHDAAACRGLPPAAAGDIDTSQADIVAAGGIRSLDEGGPPLMGLVQMFRSSSPPRRPDADAAERVAADVAKAVASSLPDSARRRRLVSRVEIVDGITVVRTTLDFDGLPAGTRAGFFAHVETASTFGRDAIYTVMWSGPRSSSPALARLADDATKTIRLDPSQRPATDDGPVITKTATRAAMVVLPLALIMAVVFRRQARRRVGKSDGLRSELWPAHTD